MTYFELLGLVSAMAGILGFFLTVYALINNKTLKEESRLTREVLVKESADTLKILDKIAALIERGFRDTAEAVTAEGSKTRSLIKTNP